MHSWAAAAFTSPDGWLGPIQTSNTDYWGRSNVMLAMLQVGGSLLHAMTRAAPLACRPAAAAPSWRWLETSAAALTGALTPFAALATALAMPIALTTGPRPILQYAEADAAVYANITTTMLNYMLQQRVRMVDQGKAMNSWASERWQDMAFGVEWMIEQPVAAPHLAELFGLLDALNAQGVNWEQWFDTFSGNAGGHNVNNAQGLKSAAVWYRRTKNESLHELSLSRVEHLDMKYGLPTGMFNGDELLPVPATRNPSRGIELCGVVEAMWSYTTMFSQVGHGGWRARARPPRNAPKCSARTLCHLTWVILAFNHWHA